MFWPFVNLVLFFFHFLFACLRFPLFASFFFHSMHVGCWCAYRFFTCPVGWHDVAFFVLPKALQCSISMSNSCDHGVRVSVKCRISTDTGCAGRRRPMTVYHEGHSVETVGVV